MTALIVLGILLLLILLVLYIRVGVLVCFGEETTFTIVVGPFKKSLAKKDSAKKTKKKEKGASSQKAKPKKHLPRQTKDEIFSLIGAVRAALSKALLKTRGRIRIAPLDVLENLPMLMDGMRCPLGRAKGVAPVLLDLFMQWR